MSAAWGSRRRQVLEEWQRNPRLRWGILAILAIVFLYLCILLVERRQDLQQEYHQRSMQLYKVGALTGQDHWILRAEAVKTAQMGLQSEIPHASSIGLAQAEVQASVRQMLNAFGPKLSVDARAPAQVQGRPGVWRLPVTIRGLLTQAQLTSILHRIESSDRLVIIEEMSIGFVQRVPNVSMTITAYYRISASGSVDDARP